MTMKRRSYMSMYDSDSEEESNNLLHNVASSPALKTLTATPNYYTTKDRADSMDIPQTPQTPMANGYGTSPLFVASGNVAPQREDGYVEFFRDSVPCPTCRGSGRIHKDDEKKLVAIIPLTDKRLKPRRTCVYILVTLLLCILAAGCLLFFLIPRSVTVVSDSPTLIPTIRKIYHNPDITNLTVQNCYNFSNKNFFAITIDGTSVSCQLKRDRRDVGKGVNKTNISVLPRSVYLYCTDVNVIFQNDYEYVTLWCESVRRYEHILAMVFKLTANYTVLGQHLQTTLNTFQYVDCGNMTNISPMPIIKPTSLSPHHKPVMEQLYYVGNKRRR